ASLAGAAVMTGGAGTSPGPGMFEILSGLSGAAVRSAPHGPRRRWLASPRRPGAAGAVIGSYHDVSDMAGVLIAREAGAVVRGPGGADQPGPDGVLGAAPGVAHGLSCF